MDYSVFPKTAEEWSERMKGAAPPTPDDQSRTWDGRILNSKEAVLEFLAELEDIRTSGRHLNPHNQPSASARARDLLARDAG